MRHFLSKENLADPGAAPTGLSRQLLTPLGQLRYVSRVYHRDELKRLRPDYDGNDSDNQPLQDYYWSRLEVLHILKRKIQKVSQIQP